MELSIDNILFILTAIFIILLLVILYSKNKVVKYICYGLLAITIIAYIYFITKSSKKEYKLFETDKVDESEEVVEEEDNYNPIIPDKYKLSNKVDIVDKAINEDKVNNYQIFKDLIYDDIFINKYTNAMREAMDIKRKKIRIFISQYNKDLKAMTVGEDKDDILAALTDRVKNTEKRSLKDVINTLTELNKLIDIRLNTISSLNTRTALSNILEEMDKLIGREDMKNFLSTQLIAFSNNPRIFLNNFQHMCLMGPSGIGKTRLAKCISYIYSQSGIMLKDTVCFTTKTSFTTAYVDESAKMTKKLLLSHLEGIVFIDEAYDLTPNNILAADHGKEAITEIVNFIDKMLGMSIIIVAGYEKDMKTKFFESNEGLDRRFPHKIVLGYYNSIELTKILLRCLLYNCRDISINRSITDYIYSIVDKLNNRRIFTKQGGDMQLIAESIGRSIYGNVDEEWNSNWKELIDTGVNNYLKYKNMSIYTRLE